MYAYNIRFRFDLIYLMHLSLQGNYVAVKVLNLKGASKDVVEGLTEEINLLKSLSHHNIVRYIGHLKKNRNELCIVMVCTISKIPMILFTEHPNALLYSI